MEAGWSGTKKTASCSAVRRALSIFLTADRNLRFQQNVAKLQIGIVVLAAGSTKLRDLQPFVPAISKALDSVTAGQVLIVPQSPDPG